MKKNILVFGAALSLLLTLSACGRPAAAKVMDTPNQPEQLAQPVQPETAAPAVSESQKEPEQTPDPAGISDDTRTRQPETRPCVGSMLLNGEAQDVFAAVTDEEICLWDSASGGQLLAVARFPIALSGAKDALESCDFTDLDGDGSCELSAEFSFADGSTASLVWFYTDGGLVYNEEFSRLPGEASAAGTE